MQPRDVWFPKNAGFFAIRALLLPLSGLYFVGWSAYRLLYQFGVKKSARPHQPVICVGNLVVGGTGKSPLVLHIADLLVGQGYEVVVGCSGYGSPKAEAATLTPPGELEPAQWGDEPAMIRWLRPHLTLVVGRRRVLAAELVARHHPKAVLLMDDGMQHLPLRKDLTILIDEQPPANPFCLPAGPNREPRSNRKHADLVLPGIFRVVTSPLKFVTPAGETTSLDAAHVLCALGQPDQFVTSLESAGVRIWSQHLKPDHDPLTSGNLWSEFPPEQKIVVTAKDFVKLRLRSDFPADRVVVALRESSIEPSDQFAVWLKQEMDRIEQS